MSSARPDTGSIILAQAPATPPGDPNDPKQKAKPKQAPAALPKGSPPAAKPQPPAPAAQPKVAPTPPPKSVTAPVAPTVQPRGVPPAPAPAAQPKVAPTPPPKSVTAPVAPTVQPRRVPPGPAPAVGSRQPAPAAPGGQPQITNNPVQPSAKPRNVQPGHPAAVGSRQPAPASPGGQPQITNNPVQPSAKPRNVQPGQPAAVGSRQPALAPAGAPAAPAAPAARHLGQPKGVQPAAPVQNVEQLRAQRQVQVVGNQKRIVEPDRRMIVREGNRAFIRHDETNRFRLWGGNPRLERRGNEQFAYVGRPGGYQIITVTDANGRLLRRMRRGPDGRDVVLINNGRAAAVGAAAGVGFAAGVLLGLAAPHIAIPRDQYIVDVSEAEPAMLYDALDAPPVEPLERAYSLDEIRDNVELRDRVRRLDVDSITFASGAWEITPEQQPLLEAVAQAMQRVLARNPNAIFLIEGHTDPVGNEDDNLSLSDRRAESVAAVLTEAFQIPPENLVTQGYGEQHLKVPTDGANRANRRVTLRNISHLLAGRF